ncbi:MAG: CCA tRNA nucleotidyltransferase [Nanoarchaeota archaeon]|nr:CCA tRNA nucleotidyltransferase [Nanoarchaeota archaeon]
MQEVLQKIKPNKQERDHFKTVSTTFLKKLNTKLTNAHAILGGSGKKDTWLAGNHDIDIFVMFDFKQHALKSAQLTNLLQTKLKQAFPKTRISRLHGSRDYFQLKHEKYIFEIIPILKINKAEKALNITDISPLHSVWVNKKGKGKKDEIRLVKQFCRANNLYGAESHLTGFSGYVLEILISHYGSFEKLLKASQKWKTKAIIDPEKYYQKKMALFHLNKSKLNSPLIVIDPVDKSRNAAAALGLEKYNLFRKLAREYLKKPQAKFFIKKELNFAELKKEAEKKKQNLVYLEVKPLSGKNDVIGGKLLKAFNFIEKQLQPFAIKKSGWDWDKFYFFLAKKELAKFEVRAGPPLEMKQFVQDFKRRNKNNFVKNKQLYAKIKINRPKLNDYLTHLLKHEYVTDRIEKVNTITVI